LKLGKVIGNVVATVKDSGLEGLRLLIVQGLDDNFQSIGEPYVAADGILTAGPGDIVYIVSKKEAAFAVPGELIPIDECIVGYVEEYHVIEEAKKKKIPPKPKPEVPQPVEITPPKKEPEVPQPVEKGT
jgi:ethanolamine utilization protein EutN